jgi:hypothetical protein
MAGIVKAFALVYRHIRESGVVYRLSDNAVNLPEYQMVDTRHLATNATQPIEIPSAV